jgi:hypothetical protein
MAPATIAGATKVRTADGRRSGWDRDSVIDAVQEWVATYGEPPRAADWNPSSAKWSGQQWRVERYRAGRADGSPWPALNSAKRPFGGSLNAAIRAAGHEPARPGPRRRGSVDPAQADRAVISPEGRAMLQAALAQAREAEKRVAVLEARLERARKTTNKESKDKEKIKTRIRRERVVDDAAVARAERRAAAAEAKAATAAAQAKESVAAARMDAAEARAAAKRLAARLERAEATVGTLREVAAINGEARRLTAAELARLRADGPSGPAVLAASLKALAKARARDGSPTALHSALLDVAAAAITWRERI